jgi:hypothetical protein
LDLDLAFVLVFALVLDFVFAGSFTAGDLDLVLAFNFNFLFTESLTAGDLDLDLDLDFCLTGSFTAGLDGDLDLRLGFKAFKVDTNS